MPNRQLDVILNLAGQYVPEIKKAAGSTDDLAKSAKSASTAVDSIDGKALDTVASESKTATKSVMNLTSTANEASKNVNQLDKTVTTKVNADTSAAESNVKSVKGAVEDATKNKTVKIGADTSAAESEVEGLTEKVDDLKDATKGVAAGIGGTAVVSGILDQDEAFAKLRSQVKGYNQDLGNSATRIYQITGADWDTVTEATVTLTNQQGLLGSELESSANQAIGFSNAFGADLGNTVTANTNIVKNFGVTSAQGFDIMTATAQSSGREIGDVVDTFVEYTPQFAALGYSAQDMGNLLASASHHGVRNLDEFADAFKEFTIRVTTSSSDAQKGFTALGATTDQQKKWTAAIKEGGPAAKQATQEIVQSIMAIKDPVKRNEAGVALFGTKWEDLRGAIGDSMLDGQNYLGDFEGRTDEVANNTSSSMLGGLNLWLRGINPIFGSALDMVTEYGTEMGLIMGSMVGTAISQNLGSVGSAVAHPIDSIKKVGSSVSETGSNIKSTLSSAGSSISSFATNAGSKIKGVGTSFVDSGKNALVAGGNYVKSGALAAAGAIKTGILTLATYAQIAAQSMLNFVMSLNPFTIIIIAIIALVAILLYLWTTNEQFRNAIIAIWAAISGAFTAAGQSIYGTLTWIWSGLLWIWTMLTGWATGFGSAAQNAGSNFVSQLVSFFTSLSGRLGALLLLVLVRILIWRQQVINYARTVGTQFVNNIINFLTSLPIRAWAIFLSFLVKIGLLSPQAAAKALAVGTSIVNTIRDNLTSLPGKMYDWGIQALTGFVNGIIDTIPGLRGALDTIRSYLPNSPPKQGPLSKTTVDTWYNWAKSLADAGTNGLNEFNVDPSLAPNPPEVGASVSAATNAVPNLDTTSLTDSVSTANTQYALLQTTSNSTLLNMASTTKSTFNSMKNTMQGTLNTLVSDNKKGYTNIDNTTKSTLSSLKSQTSSSINAVKSSWTGMRDGLVNAAQNIKTNVGNDISNLSSNIASFYRKIRNPALLIAGPGPGFAGPGKISLPRISGNFAGPSNSKELDLLDNSPYIPCLNSEGCYAGSWDVNSPNISAIMSRVNGYVPNFGDYGSFGLNVNDFKGNSFPISGNFNAFATVADKAISGTRYKFYYNSAYPSPAAALNAKSFNCWDGAMIIGAMASAFNLPWELIHGFWNNVGHVWARVQGHDMDTTAKQHGYGWTSPKVRVAGPISTGDSSSGNSDVIKIELEDNVNLNIKLEGLPDNIDENTIKSFLKKVITDSDVIKKLGKNKELLNILNEAIKKGINKKKRAGG